uniref:Putative ovule protein n=1 Tax=Solanum chacoense TaxID=4108 RepID=A0A0V0GTU8_SOLCH
MTITWRIHTLTYITHKKRNVRSHISFADHRVIPPFLGKSLAFRSIRVSMGPRLIIPIKASTQECLRHAFVVK